MSIIVTTIEKDTTYEITGTFVDKNGDPVVPTLPKFEVRTADYASVLVTSSMTVGISGEYITYIDTTLLEVGKYIFRVEGVVDNKKIGDNTFVKVMYVEPE